MNILGQDYSALVRNALSILEVPCSDLDDLETLLISLDQVFKFPATKNEQEIQYISKKIVADIRGGKPNLEILALLEKLKSEVTYSLFD